MTSPPGTVAERAEALTPRIAWLFMIGSSCFAVASVPGVSSAVPPGVVGLVYFIGSIFFTSAGYLQFAQSANADAVPTGSGSPDATWRWFGVVHRSVDWWGSAVQLVGTLWFNVNTFDAVREGLTTSQELLRVWTPDFLGSICFLVASECALRAVGGQGRERRRTPAWRIAAINMAGSVFFMASALAAFVRPATGELLDASLANSGTLLGAVCFFVAAFLLLGTTRENGRRRGP